MIAGKSSEINSSVLSDMKELPLSAVISLEATTFTNRIINLSSMSLCDEYITGGNVNKENATQLTPVENSTSVIIDALLLSAFVPSKEGSITITPETPEQQQQQPTPSSLEENATQQVPPVSISDKSTTPVSISDKSTPQAETIGCLAVMKSETLDIPSHIDSQMLHHSICVLVSLLFRFPVYFKPLYRLAWVFYKLKAFKVTYNGMLTHSVNCTYITQLAKMCLLGPLPLEFQQAKILPLFVLKSNVFTVSKLL